MGPRGSRRRAAAISGAPEDLERREPSIRVIMMPKDTNAHGTIFGGVILSYIDQAGAVEAKRHGAEFLVTVAMREAVFHEPVYVGDLVSFYTRLVRIGLTSITVAVQVFSQPGEGVGNRVKVTEAEVTYVNLDKNRRPAPIRK
jgi:acyl-CoA thioesterase YciA